jgi:hypothetical protein
MYNISDYSYRQAQKLGVTIKPSTRKNKKIDVYNKNNEYIVSIGDIKYKDFSFYLEDKGAVYALDRSRYYKTRHKKNIKKVGSAGYYAANILW